jgi:hypothetical protein
MHIRVQMLICYIMPTKCRQVTLQGLAEIYRERTNGYTLHILHNRTSHPEPPSNSVWAPGLRTHKHVHTVKTTVVLWKNWVVTILCVEATHLYFAHQAKP